MISTLRFIWLCMRYPHMLRFWRLRNLKVCSRKRGSI